MLPVVCGSTSVPAGEHKSAWPLIDPNLHSCGSVPPHGYRELAHPEPGFYIVGIKSYGRAPTFLMFTGYEQVRPVTAALAGDFAAADDVHLVLPEHPSRFIAEEGRPEGPIGSAGRRGLAATRVDVASCRPVRPVNRLCEVGGCQPWRNLNPFDGALLDGNRVQKAKRAGRGHGLPPPRRASSDSACWSPVEC